MRAIARAPAEEVRGPERAGSHASLPRTYRGCGRAQGLHLDPQRRGLPVRRSDDVTRPAAARSAKSEPACRTTGIITVSGPLKGPRP